MNVTNNFFIVNGQAFKEYFASKEDEYHILDFTSIIYPLDTYGNHIWVGMSFIE